MAQKIRREYWIYLIIKGLWIWSFSHMKLRRPIFIPEVSCEKKCEMNEWMNEIFLKIKQVQQITGFKVRQSVQLLILKSITVKLLKSEMCLWEQRSEVFIYNIHNIWFWRSNFYSLLLLLETFWMMTMDVHFCA